MSDEETAARAEVRLPPPPSRLDRARALRAVGWAATASGHRQALSPVAACWQAVKNEGNELFKEAHFADALEKYNQAIDLNPEVPTYYCNRTFRRVEFPRPLAPAPQPPIGLCAARPLLLESAERRPEPAAPTPAGARASPGAPSCGAPRAVHPRAEQVPKTTPTTSRRTHRSTHTLVHTPLHPWATAGTPTPAEPRAAFTRRGVGKGP